MHYNLLKVGLLRSLNVWTYSTTGGSSMWQTDATYDTMDTVLCSNVAKLTLLCCLGICESLLDNGGLCPNNAFRHMALFRDFLQDNITVCIYQRIHPNIKYNHSHWIWSKCADMMLNNCLTTKTLFYFLFAKMLIYPFYKCRGTFHFLGKLILAPLGLH